MNSTVMQQLCGKTIFFPQQTEQEVLRPNVVMRQLLGFLSCIGQHASVLIAEWQVDRSVDLLADGRVLFDLSPDGFYCSG